MKRLKNIFSIKEYEEIIYITKPETENDKKSSLIYSFLKFFIIYAFINLFAASFCSIYNIKINFLILLIVSFGFLLLFNICIKNRIAAISVYISVFLVLAVLVVIFRETVINSFRFVFYSIVNDLIEMNFAFDGLLTPSAHELLNSAGENSSLMSIYNNITVILVTVFMCGVLAVSSLRNNSFFIPFLFSFLVLSPGFALGLEINKILFILLVCILGAIYAFSLNAQFLKKKKDNNLLWGRYGICGAAAFVIFLASFLISDTLLPKDKLFKIGNGAPGTITITDTQLMDFNAMFQNALFKLGFNVDFMDDVSESPYMSLDVLKNRTEDVYVLKSYLPNGKYLRQAIGVDVETDYWKPFSDDYHKRYRSIYNKGFSPERQMYEFYSIIDKDFEKNFRNRNYTDKYGFFYDVVNIENIKKTYSIIMPMKPYDGIVKITPEKPISFKGDSVLYDKTRKGEMFKYTVPIMSQLSLDEEFIKNFPFYQYEYKKIYSDYVAGINKNLTEEQKKYLDNESEYREFVKANYLNVNNNFVNKEIIDKGKSICLEGKTPIEKAHILEKYFKNNFKYNKDPKFSPDADPLYEVMFNKKEGYCSHFATLMTYILRAQNIPARYVTGYYVSDLKKVSNLYGAVVNQSEYHAWVEVYFDGIGWLTFDPTPGFVVDEVSRENDYVIPTYEKPEKPQEPTMEPMPSYEGPTTEEEAFVTSDEKNAGHNFDIKTFILIVFISLLILAFPAIILFGSIKRRTKFERFKNMSSAESVKGMYRYMLSILNIAGIKPENGENPKDYFSKADKQLELCNRLNSLWSVMCRCEFGNKDISEEERTAFYNTLYEIYNKTLKKTNFIKRIYYNIKL